MGLNLSRGKPLKYYTSDRIANYIGKMVYLLLSMKKLNFRNL